MLLVFGGSVSSLAGTCTNVQAQIQEYAMVSGCTSRFNLCTISYISGNNITGVAQLTATNILPIAGTPFAIISGDVSVTNLDINSKHGTLTIKSTAAYDTATGDILDYEIITGGTGDFKNATGNLRVKGTFLNGSGTSQVTGVVCVP
jgi:hypothetical protein